MEPGCARRTIKGDIMSLNHSICVNTQFKQRLDTVKTAVKDKLGVGISTANAYDLISVCQGFENYQTAKGRSTMPFYEWGINISSKETPYYLTKPIGHHRNKEEAYIAGLLLLENSPEDAAWTLLENGNPIEKTNTVAVKETRKTNPLLDKKTLSSDLQVYTSKEKMSNTEQIIEYMKTHYSHTYMRFSNEGKLDHKATFKAINATIKESKKCHCGMDMSGLVSLLSTIKLERVALGELDIGKVKLFDYQWEKVDEMIKEGITREEHYTPSAQEWTTDDVNLFDDIFDND